MLHFNSIIKFKLLSQLFFPVHSLWNFAYLFLHTLKLTTDKQRGWSTIEAHNTINSSFKAAEKRPMDNKRHTNNNSSGSHSRSESKICFVLWNEEEFKSFLNEGHWHQHRLRKQSRICVFYWNRIQKNDFKPLKNASSSPRSDFHRAIWMKWNNKRKSRSSNRGDGSGSGRGSLLGLHSPIL